MWKKTVEPSMGSFFFSPGMVTPSTTPSKKFVLWVAFCCRSRWSRALSEKNLDVPPRCQPTTNHLDPFRGFAINIIEILRVLVGFDGISKISILFICVFACLNMGMPWNATK